MLFTSNTIANLTATKFCMERQLHTMKSEITEIYHTTLKASQAKLVFGYDMFMPTKYPKQTKYV